MNSLWNQTLKCKVKRTQVSKESISYSDLLTTGNRLFITGPVGAGKSTLIRNVAYDWVRHVKSPTQFQNKLLFVLDIAKLSPDMNLEDAIIDQVLPDIKISNQDLEIFLCKNSQKCMFLLDGMDTCLDQGIGEKIFESDCLKDSTVIVTSRFPDSLFLSQQYEYQHIKLNGFSTTNIKNYVSKFSSVVVQKSVGQAGHGSEKYLLERVEGMHYPEAVTQNPLLLGSICGILVAKSEEISQTNMFKELVDILCKHYLSQHQLLSLDDHDEFKMHVGKVALKSLFDMANIDDSKLEYGGIERRRRSKRGIKGERARGLKETGQNGIAPVVELNDVTSLFLHTSILQYFAADFVECNHDTWNACFDQILSKLINQDYQWFLKFCCGMNRLSLDKILPFIGKVGKDLYEQFLLEIGETNLFLAHYPIGVDDPSMMIDYIFSHSLDWNIYSPWQTSMMTHLGGICYLPEVGACLEVPEGSLPKGTQAEFTLSVHWGNESPPVGEKLYLIGPTILISCCPETVTLKKPLKLTLPHSATNIKKEDVQVWSRQYKREEKCEWCHNNKESVTETGVIDVSTKVLGCYAPCIHVYGNGDSHDAAHSNDPQERAGGRQGRERSPTGLSPPRHRRKRDRGCSAFTSRDNRESYEVADSRPIVDYEVKIYVTKEAVKPESQCDIPVSMAVYIIRNDEDDSAKCQYRYQTPLAHHEFKLDSRYGDGRKNPPIIGEIRLDNGWTIQDASEDSGGINKIPFEVKPMEINMRGFDFRCSKPNLEAAEVLSGVLVLSGDYFRNRSQSRLPLRFDSRCLFDTIKLEKIEEKLFTRYGNIIRTATINVCQETKGFVVKVYDVHKKSFPFTKKCRTREDSRDYLREILDCGFFDDAENTIERLLKERHKDSHSRRIRTYQISSRKAGKFIKDLRRLVRRLATCAIPSDLRSGDTRDLDKLEVDMKVNTKRVLDEAERDLRYQEIRI